MLEIFFRVLNEKTSTPQKNENRNFLIEDIQMAQRYAEKMLDITYHQGVQSKQQ